MPKPTSTALNVNDNLSDGNVDPSHGDAPGPGPATRKPSVTSASATRLSRPAVATAATYPPSIEVVIDADGNFTFPNGQDVQNGGTVTLSSTTKTDVYAYPVVNGTPTWVGVFQSPYRAKPGGKSYKLLSSISGDVVLSLSSSPLSLSTSESDGGANGGANGTINVRPT